jgi:hypothetical protein
MCGIHYFLLVLTGIEICWYIFNLPASNLVKVLFVFVHLFNVYSLTDKTVLTGALEA